MHKKNGLIDSDKVLVTVALWIACIVIFATALTLPMLPEQVTIFYRPTEMDLPDYYSKYNNIFLILMALIPVAIILATAFFKRRNRLQSNFISLMMFSIMLSLLISSVIIFGITEQFDASSTVQKINFYALGITIIMFVLSVTSAIVPAVLHSPSLIDKCANSVGYKWNVLRAMADYWIVGAYGFLLGAIVCVFIDGAFCFIPLVVCILAYVVTMLVIGNRGLKP